MQEEGLEVGAALKAVQAATALARPNRAFLAGGDVRMGDFILLVDSDTRVPEHCILPVVSELLRSPQVAFTQHYTTPLQARAALLLNVAVLPPPAMPHALPSFASQCALPMAVQRLRWRHSSAITSCCHWSLLCHPSLCADRGRTCA